MSIASAASSTRQGLEHFAEMSGKIQDGLSRSLENIPTDKTPATTAWSVGYQTTRMSVGRGVQVLERLAALHSGTESSVYRGLLSEVDHGVVDSIPQLRQGLLEAQGLPKRELPFQLPEHELPFLALAPDVLDAVSAVREGLEMKIDALYMRP